MNTQNYNILLVGMKQNDQKGHCQLKCQGSSYFYQSEINIIA